jgi:hypothetical protein
MNRVHSDGGTPRQALASIEACVAAELQRLTEELELDPQGRRSDRATRIMFLDEGAGIDGGD